MCNWCVRVTVLVCVCGDPVCLLYHNHPSIGAAQDSQSPAGACLGGEGSPQDVWQHGPGQRVTSL